MYGRTPCGTAVTSRSGAKRCRACHAPEWEAAPAGDLYALRSKDLRWRTRHGHQRYQVRCVCRSPTRADSSQSRADPAPGRARASTAGKRSSRKGPPPALPLRQWGGDWGEGAPVAPFPQSSTSYETTDAVSSRRDRAARRPPGCYAIRTWSAAPDGPRVGRVRRPRPGRRPAHGAYFLVPQPGSSLLHRSPMFAPPGQARRRRFEFRSGRRAFLDDLGQAVGAQARARLPLRPRLRRRPAPWSGRTRACRHEAAPATAPLHKGGT
jgi:hypothetical protein